MGDIGRTRKVKKKRRRGGRRGGIPAPGEVQEDDRGGGRLVSGQRCFRRLRLGFRGKPVVFLWKTKAGPIVAVTLEKAALSDEYFVKRKLYPNVDFYSGLIYRAMGFPPEFFPVLFAIPRMAGYLAHWRESLEDPDTKILRPQQTDTREHEGPVQGVLAGTVPSRKSAARSASAPCHRTFSFFVALGSTPSLLVDVGVDPSTSHRRGRHSSCRRLPVPRPSLMPPQVRISASNRLLLPATPIILPSQILSSASVDDPNCSFIVDPNFCSHLRSTLSLLQTFSPHLRSRLSWLQIQSPSKLLCYFFVYLYRFCALLRLLLLPISVDPHQHFPLHLQVFLMQDDM
ncbi:hypothetical protein KSP40_PGU022162 [Platanthera guangdongensis]|uniref:Citrate synthase n=1 Tax=Platanthera guangdongensis TaxID=2320717 RepID=A0ABR2MHP0_9ASPA